MTNLTEYQEQEINRRYQLSKRCLCWMDANSRNSLAAQYGVSIDTVRSILSGNEPRFMNTKDASAIKRKAKHLETVRKIQFRHGVKAMRKEYRIGSQTIKIIGNGIKQKGRRKPKVQSDSWVGNTPMWQFATMRLPCSYPSQAGYY